MLNNHKELVQLLLDRGADASVKNEVCDSISISRFSLEGRREQRPERSFFSSGFVFQFGKGVLEMARVFDRQVGMLLLPIEANFVAFKKKLKNPNPWITYTCFCLSRMSSPY